MATNIEEHSNTPVNETSESIAAVTSSNEDPNSTTTPSQLTTPTLSFKAKLSQWLAAMIKSLLLLTTGSTNPDSLINSFSTNPANFSGEGIFTFLNYLNIIIVPLGGIISGTVAHFIGRKKAIHLAVIPLLAFRIWSAFANGWQLCLAAVLTSLCSEFFKAPVLTHVSESASPQMRGKLGATTATSMMLGSFIQLFMQTFFSPRTINIINCLLPVICFVLLAFVPESPEWLIMHNKPEEAKKSLAWMRGWASLEEIDVEFKEMLARHNKTATTNAEAKQEAKKESKKTIRKKCVDYLKEHSKISFLWPLGIIAFMYFLVHFTGITSLLTHPDGIFATLQTPISKSYTVALLGAANSLGSSISISEINKYGKRRMAIASLIGVGVCCVTIATYAYVYNIKSYDSTPPNGTITIETLADSRMETHKWIPVIVLFLLAIISFSGISNIPTMLAGELFPKESRSSGVGFSSSITSLFSNIVSKTFIPCVNFFTFPGTYYNYSILSSLGALVLYFILPETEGKHLHDIENHFKRVSKLDNKVARTTTKNVKKGKVKANNKVDVTNAPV